MKKCAYVKCLSRLEKEMYKNPQTCPEKNRLSHKA